MSNQNLIVNGDFETDRVIPSASNWHGNYLIEHTPTGWSISSAGVDLLNDEHGKFGAEKTPYGQYVELDGRRNTSIEQTISTIAGQTYGLSFDWALPSYEGGDYSFPDRSSQFQVKVNDEIVFEYDGSYGIRNEWTNQALNFTADGSETKISFIEVGYSDAEGTLIDNISVTLNHEIQTSKTYKFDKPSWFRLENREGNGSANSTSKPKNGEIWLAGAQHNQNNNSQDVWIARYTTGGELIEEKIIGEASNDYAVGVEAYEGGAIYTGTTYGEFEGNTNRGRMDAYAFRYDSTDQGNKWINQIASSSSGAADWATNIVIDSDKHIYATGNSGFGASINGQSGFGQHDGYVVKLTPNGDTLWTKLVGSSGNDSLGDGVATNDNNMVFVGSTNGRVNGATHNGGEINYLNGYDGYIAKYSSDGNHIWTTQVGGNDNERVLAVAKTPEDDLIVAGFSEGKVTTEGQPGAGGRDIFISKVKSSGERLWEKKFGGEGNEIAYDVEVLADGRILLVGSTDGDLWESKSSGNKDAFIIELTSNGEIIQTTLLGTESDDVARSIRSGESGELVISGYTEGGLLGSDSNGSMNAFIAYYEPVEKNIIQKIRGSSLYTIVDGPSWTQAEANSVKLGGHLVTINNIEEYKWAADSFWSADNLNGMAFIGLNDAQQEGNYEWASGQQTEWNDLSDLICAQNWFDQQQHFGGWDYGIIGAGSTWEEIGLDDRYVPYQDRGTVILMDNSASFYANHGIAILGAAEIPFIRRGDSAYVIVEGPTWEEAEANANALGGHLVTINDAEENKWILETFIQEFQNGAAFIGYSDSETEGDWIWSSGNPTTYTNWDTNNPSNSSGVEDVGTIQFGDGSWNDIATNYWNWFGDEGDIKGIAEIPLAANNTPTGTPTLTGDFKVGQIISIDASKIEDTDNHDYWTPSYEYSWEIADDPRLTTMMPIWESLKTADAIDGNKTLEITPDLKGKLIRGLVSYVDGYGTNEVVESVSKLIKQPFDNQIGSVSGKGKLRGTKYVDQFTFDQFESFGRKTADKIIKFNSSQGDTIGVSGAAFPSLQGAKEVRLASANTKKQLKIFSKTDYDFVYYEKNGCLFFNGNGEAKGWGDPDEGGLFAILKGKPELSASDFTLLA